MSWFLLIAVALYVGLELLKPKQRIEGERPKGEGDFSFPTATQGRPVPIIWGTVNIAGPNWIWWGDLKQEAITQRVKTGLFSAQRVTTGYRYFLGMQHGICRGGPSGIDAITRILVGKKEVFLGTFSGGTISINKPDHFGGDLGAGGLVGTLRLHTGTPTQAVNAYLQAFQGGANTPTYNGTCYTVFEKGYHGNATTLDPWEYQVRRVVNANPLGLSPAGVNSNVDANPMNVAYEALTDTEWGKRYPAADIDVASFVAAATTLRNEGNGWSAVWDRTTDVNELLQEIMRQIDGYIFLDHVTGKWTVKLARNDYDINTVPLIDETSGVEVLEYKAGNWTATANVVRVLYASRSLEGTEAYATAMDMANAQIQGGGTELTTRTVVVEETFPGVKNGALADQIAWRELRGLAYPLVRAKLAVDRRFYAVKPGDVLAWTDAQRGFTRLPLRVVRPDYGQLQDGRIVLDCVQDTFQFAVGGFGGPPDSGWTPPPLTVVPFPSTQQLAFEAPRAFLHRDPSAPGFVGKYWTSGRNQGIEVTYKIRQRHSSGTPSGAFADDGEGAGFMLIGELQSALPSGRANPTSSIVVVPTPNTQTEIETAFTDDPDIVDQGTNLLSLILVDSEFMLVRNASVSGANVSLNGVYRGVLDSAQAVHAAGAKVYLIFVGGAMNDSSLPLTDNVEVKLLPRSLTQTLAEGSATTIAFTMDRRVQRPYAPGRLDLNGSAFPTGTVSLDFLGGGAEATGIDLDFLRRDFRTAEGGDEIAALGVDAPTLFPDYPTRNNTTHEVQVRNDPAGANTLLFTLTGIAGATAAILRLRILRHTDGVVPTTMRLVVHARHDEAGQTGLASRHGQQHDFSTASSFLAGKHNFGARAQNGVSTVYTATQAGQYDFTLSSSFGSGDVQYRLNAGAFTTLIVAGGTTGSILGVAVSDTIELRHTSATAGVLKQLDMDAPSTGQDGYMVLFNP